jgi:hypothetical protein
VDAGDIEDARVDFDGLDVYNAAGNKLGDVDGFIVDRDSNRPYYIVVDSGGWFSSQRYLVPIGHARLDTDNDCLRIDIERAAIERFPPFDAARFEEMPEDEARRFNTRLLEACCPDELKGRRAEGRWDYEAWSHYRVPDWWPSRPLGRVTTSTAATDRLTSRSTEDARPGPLTRPATGPLEGALGERVVARDRSPDLDATLNDRPLEPVSDRAQPGDVLGIEHEGETTKLGDTAGDEDERRREDEKESPNDRER